ncbi:sigma-54-dependent Fis family transcriptional regulator [Schinkia sp. CFF1]
MLNSTKSVEQSHNFVENSWKRCLNLGYQPEHTANDQIISPNEVQELLQENNDLLTIAEPILEKKLFPHIKKRKQIILIADLNGNILFSAGNMEFSKNAQKVQLQVGANWREKNKGTNAIGLALHEKQPSIVYGRDHFFAENQFLSCSACPIYSSTGEVIGVINISGDKKETFTKDEMVLVQLTADTIQNHLFYEKSRKEHLLTLKELDVLSHTHPQALLSLDQENRIVRANRAALNLLGKDCIGQPLPQSWNYQVETIYDQTKKVWRSIALFTPKTSKESKRTPYTFSEIKGNCPKIEQVKRMATKASYSEFPILLNGESGTGKELFAQSIHNNSLRRNNPFIAINCSAIPDALIESELFGYNEGAFTGAKAKGSIGKFEAANHGTIFLDEIGDMSLKAQAALLRVLQEKTIMPVGSNASKPIDVRVIAATHRNLKKEIEKGHFREDLYYRIRGIGITLPSLRERTDILVLAEDYLKNMDYKGGFADGAKKVLTTYHWPGNIRELRSVLMEAMFLAEGENIDSIHLNLELESFEKKHESGHKILTLKEAEMEAIKAALREAEGNISKAAQILEIGRNTLYRKLKEYSL